MKKITVLMLFVCLLSKGFSQTYHPGSGLNLSNDSFHLGGSIYKNTYLKGRISGTKYNYQLDSFASQKYMADSIDMEGTDSIRLASGKLVKLMSLGDVHVGATNSIVLDGSVWLKRHRNLSGTKKGFLVADNCGRVNVDTSLTFSGYLQKGGNDFTGEPNVLEKKQVLFGSLDSTSLHFSSYWNSLGVSNIGSHVVLNADGSIATYSPTGTAFYGSDQSHATLRLGTHNGYISRLPFYSYNGSFTAESGYGINLGFYNTFSTGDAYYFGGSGFAQDGAGTSNFFNVSTTFNASGNGSVTNLMNLEANVYASSDIGSTSLARGLYVNVQPLGVPESYAKNFRAIQTTRGHVAFNTITGNTLIGTNLANGKKLQVEGDASITEGLTIGDTLTVPSALLHVNTTTKGFLPPRLSVSNRNSISAPANGLIIYNTDSSWLEVYTPDGWYKLLSNSVSSGGGHLSRSAEANDKKSSNSFVSRIGDGKSTSFTIQHNLNSEFVMVQFIDCGAEANCNLLLSIPDGARLEINGSNEVQLTFKEAPAFNRYKIMFLKLH